MMNAHVSCVHVACALLAGVLITLVLLGPHAAVLVAGAGAAFLYWVCILRRKEGFISSQTLYDMDPSAFTPPTQNNPAMNVLPTTYLTDPERSPAAPAYDDRVSDQIEALTRNLDREYSGSTGENVYDEGDDISLKQSMRAWYATANTQIPNQQDVLAEWCYGNAPSCKEGDPLACSTLISPTWLDGTI